MLKAQTFEKPRLYDLPCCSGSKRLLLLLMQHWAYLPLKLFLRKREMQTYQMQPKSFLAFSGSVSWTNKLSLHTSC